MKARFIRANQQANVQVHCSNDHDTTLGIEDVAIVHANGTLVGFRFDCPRCGTTNEVDASAETLAVLHAFGVTALEPSSRPEPELVGAEREAVSLRVLLDHPEIVEALHMPQRATARADAHAEEQSGTPSP
jgi:hypothetical protein